MRTTPTHHHDPATTDTTDTSDPAARDGSRRFPRTAPARLTLAGAIGPGEQNACCPEPIGA